MLSEPSYQKIVRKGPARFCYLLIKLEFEPGVSVEVDPLSLKAAVLEHLKQLHGEAGKALNVNLLRFTPDTREAILQVQSSGLVKLWSALTLAGTFGGEDCAYRVQQVSPHLMALASSSRLMEPN